MTGKIIDFATRRNLRDSGQKEIASEGPLAKMPGDRLSNIIRQAAIGSGSPLGAALRLEDMLQQHAGMQFSPNLVIQHQKTMIRRKLHTLMEIAQKASSEQVSKNPSYFEALRRTLKERCV